MQIVHLTLQVTCGFFSAKKTCNCFAYLILLWFAYVKKKKTGLNAKHCRLVVNKTNHCYFLGWFPNAKKQAKLIAHRKSHDYCKVRHFVDMFFEKGNKEADKEKIIVPEIFNKLNNDKWKLYTGARATKQKYVSVYIFLWRKTFLKTGVYIYIYIYTPVF